MESNVSARLLANPVRFLDLSTDLYLPNVSSISVMSTNLLG